jgi:hypothetical protein
MNLNGNISNIRGGSVSADFSVGRGAQYGAPKKTFGEKMHSLSSGLGKEAEGARLRSQLDMLHTQIRMSPNVARLCDLVDDYLLVAATLAETPASAGAPMPGAMLPPGRIFAAVIAALRKSTGNAGPVVSGDNIGAPGHSLT